MAGKRAGSRQSRRRSPCGRGSVSGWARSTAARPAARPCPRHPHRAAAATARQPCRDSPRTLGADGHADTRTRGHEDSSNCEASRRQRRRCRCRDRYRGTEVLRYRDASTRRHRRSDAATQTQASPQRAQPSAVQGHGREAFPLASWGGTRARRPDRPDCRAPPRTARVRSLRAAPAVIGSGRGGPQGGAGQEGGREGGGEDKRPGQQEFKKGLSPRRRGPRWARPRAGHSPPSRRSGRCRPPPAAAPHEPDTELR